MNYNKICENQKAIGHIMRVVFAVKEIAHQNQATVALVKFTKLLNNQSRIFSGWTWAVWKYKGELVELWKRQLVDINFN